MYFPCSLFLYASTSYQIKLEKAFFNDLWQFDLLHALAFLVKRNLSQHSNKSESDEAPALKPRNSQRKNASSQVKRRTPSLYDNPPCNLSNKRPNDIHFYQNMNGPDWKRLVEAGYDNLRIPPRRSRSTKSNSPPSSGKGLFEFLFLIYCLGHTLHARIMPKIKFHKVCLNACCRAPPFKHDDACAVLQNACCPRTWMALTASFSVAVHNLQRVAMFAWSVFYLLSPFFCIFKFKTIFKWADNLFKLLVECNGRSQSALKFKQKSKTNKSRTL